MNLVVHIPHRMTEEDSGALSLAQRAPTFVMDWASGNRIGIATFPDLPKGIDLALQVIGEAVNIRGAWASVNARPVSSLTKLWQRLECYRESLLVSDPTRHCMEKSAFFHTLVGCEASRCPVPCQFLCTPCMQAAHEGTEAHHGQPIEAAAAFAEIEWCPHLAYAMSPALQSRPILLNPRSATS